MINNELPYSPAQAGSLLRSERLRSIKAKQCHAESNGKLPLRTVFLASSSAQTDSIQKQNYWIKQCRSEILNETYLLFFKLYHKQVKNTSLLCQPMATKDMLQEGKRNNTDTLFVLISYSYTRLDLSFSPIFLHLIIINNEIEQYLERRQRWYESLGQVGYYRAIFFDIL